MTPRVTDNDAGEIIVSLYGQELRGWSYNDDAERRVKMLAAREYVEGWCDARCSAESEAETLLRRIATSSYSEGTMHDAIRAAKDCVDRRPPTEPQSASKSEAIAWECTDERYSYRYIKGIVTTSTNTLKAWREEGIAFADLVRRSQAESAPQPAVDKCSHPNAKVWFYRDDDVYMICPDCNRRWSEAPSLTRPQCEGK